MAGIRKLAGQIPLHRQPKIGFVVFSERLGRHSVADGWECLRFLHFVISAAGQRNRKRLYGPVFVRHEKPIVMGKPIGSILFDLSQPRLAGVVGPVASGVDVQLAIGAEETAGHDLRFGIGTEIAGDFQNSGSSHRLGR